MVRYLTRATIFIVSILTSYLITGAIEERILSETERFRPLTATAVGMAIIVLIFAPIFSYTDRLTESAVKAGLQQSKSGAGTILGVLAFIIIVLVILFALYLDRWFQISLLDAL